MAENLRIGIDTRAAAEEPAGRGRYVRELLAHLPDGPEYVRFDRNPYGPDPLWHLRAARDASVRCDVFLSTNSYLTAWFTRVPTVLVVYDLIPWMPDMNPQMRAAVIEKTTIRFALRRAAHAICISESTEHDLLDRFPSMRGRTSAIPLGVSDALARMPDLDEARARLALPDEFVLATGTLEPRKNLPRLIEAHRSLDDALPLLIAGPEGWEVERALEGADDSVRLLGYVSDEDLAALYRLCTVFAYPSLYEGFGLPLAEAMRCGAACVTSDLSSLPEVGGDAVVYCDPTDVASIAAALQEARARHEDLSRDAVERAKRFNWRDVAEETVEVLKRARTRPR